MSSKLCDPRTGTAALHRVAPQVASQDVERDVPTRMVELRVALGVVGPKRLRGDAHLLEWESAADGWTNQQAVLAHGNDLEIGGSAFEDAVGHLVATGIDSHGDQAVALALSGREVTPWASFLRNQLVTLIGDAQWDALLAAAGQPSTLLRIVFRPLDEGAARLPFEFLAGRHAGPLAGDPDLRVSLLRTADRLDDAAPRRASSPVDGTAAFARTLCICLETSDHALADLVASLRDRPDVDVEPFGSTRVQQLLSGASTVIVAGHAEDGLFRLPAGGSMSSEKLSDLLAGRPALAVIAACGSGHSDTGASTVLQAARTGLAVAVGFEGSHAFVSTVVDFLGVALAAARAPSSVGVARAWELQLADARVRLQSLGGLPVAYVHPSLLEPGRRPRSLRSHRRAASRTVTVPVWRVPGQVACWRDDARLMRVPLAVDVGQRIELSLGAPRAQLAGRHWAVELEELEELAAVMGARSGEHIYARLFDTLSSEAARTPHSDGWARRSGQLVALGRALAAALATTMSPRARAYLSVCVRADFGAYEGRPHVVDVESGAFIRTIGGDWPALHVAPQACAPKHLPATLPWLAGSPSGSELTAPQSLIGIIEQQRRATATMRIPNTRWYQQAVRGRSEAWVVIPNAAIVTLDPDSARGVVTLAGVRPVTDVHFDR